MAKRKEGDLPSFVHLKDIGLKDENNKVLVSGIYCRSRALSRTSEEVSIILIKFYSGNI